MGCRPLLQLPGRGISFPRYCLGIRLLHESLGPTSSSSSRCSPTVNVMTLRTAPRNTAPRSGRSTRPGRSTGLFRGFIEEPAGEARDRRSSDRHRWATGQRGCATCARVAALAAALHGGRMRWGPGPLESPRVFADSGSGLPGRGVGGRGATSTVGRGCVDEHAEYKALRGASRPQRDPGLGSGLAPVRAREWVLGARDAACPRGGESDFGIDRGRGVDDAGHQRLFGRAAWTRGWGFRKGM